MMAASCFVSSAVSTNSSSSSVGGLACLPSRKSAFPNPVSPSPCGFAGSSGTGWAPAPGGASHDGTPHERAVSSCRKTSNPSSSSVRLRERQRFRGEVCALRRCQEVGGVGGTRRMWPAGTKRGLKRTFAPRPWRGNGEEVPRPEDCENKLFYPDELFVNTKSSTC